MRNPATLLLMILFLGFIACDSNSLPKDAQATDEIQDPEWDEVRTTLKGAAIADTLTVMEQYYFSNNTEKDLFVLHVLPGLIATSVSILTIKTSDGHVLHTETFDNDYLVRYIFEPQRIPQNLNQNSYTRFFYAYGKAITKKQFENYTIKSARSFFPNSVSLVSKKDVLEHRDLGSVDNLTLYEKVLADSSPNIINIPCFSCDEGHSFYVYSQEERMAKPILSAD